MLEQAWVEHDKWDERSTPANRDAFRPMIDVALRHINELEMAISFARASTPAGMLAQIAVAFDAVDLAANGSSYEICAASQDRAERCLFSIAAALCAMTNIDREGFSAGRYLPISCDKLASLSPEATR